MQANDAVRLPQTPHGLGFVYLHPPKSFTRPLNLQVPLLTNRVCEKHWGCQPGTLYGSHNESHMPHWQISSLPTRTLFEALYIMCITGMQKV